MRSISQHNPSVFAPVFDKKGSVFVVLGPKILYLCDTLLTYQRNNCKFLSNQYSQSIYPHFRDSREPGPCFWGISSNNLSLVVLIVDENRPLFAHKSFVSQLFATYLFIFHYNRADYICRITLVVILHIFKICDFGYLVARRSECSDPNSDGSMFFCMQK